MADPLSTVASVVVNGAKLYKAVNPKQFVKKGDRSVADARALVNAADSCLLDREKMNFRTGCKQ